MKKRYKTQPLQYLQGSMKRTTLFATGVVALLTSLGLAFQAPSDGPYKVLKTARVGGEGGTDYIFADPVGRRLYIPRGATQAQPATDTRPEVPASEKRLTIFDLDTLEPVGVIPGVGGNGTTVCPKTGHGFTSDHPKPSMFDVKTMKLIRRSTSRSGSAPTASTVTRPAIACTSAAIRRRACWSSTQRTGTFSATSTSAARRSRRSATAKAPSTRS